MKRQEYFKYLAILILSIVISYAIYAIRESKATPLIAKAEIAKPSLPASEIKNLLPKSIPLGAILSFKKTEAGKSVKLQIKNNLGQNHLFVLIGQGDCYDCYKDVPFWNSTQHLYDSLKVYVVISGGNEKYMKDFITANGIDVPVFIDTENQLFPVLKKIPNVYTPIVLFVNKQGDLVSATNSNYGDLGKQEVFVKFLNRNL
ncbi:thioredoxin domain-containing protein [Pedobacter metabolipauper]|uniref:Uncharacterized protein n=1 Tax=Pedobacter metabolipauper TaxID=425513 RepID=A0A4R6T081_9SPHI|nr:thioredoxin family protein [Pedobacter metabolipauper]TDQ11755.1 hypothetical protein ATK78_0883 [Pedobacter metabolipauper]